MREATDQVLTRAYELIESDQLDEAKELLDPLVKADTNNADAWWLYAHSVRDREAARTALQNALRADPNYPDARDLLNTLEREGAPSPAIRPIGAAPQPATIPDLPPVLPESADEAWDFEGAGTEKAKSPKLLTPRRLALLMPILVIILVVALLLILNPSGVPQIADSVSPTAEIASVPTLPVTEFTPIARDTVVPNGATEEVLPTNETPIATVTTQLTEEVTDVDETPITIATDQPGDATSIAQASSVTQTGEATFQSIYDALDSFVLPRESVEITQTGLGQTLLVSVCTVAGPEMRAALPEAMTAIAGVSDSIEAEIDAVGVRMLNCGTNTILLVITASLDDALAFANGELSEQEFQARWRSL